MDGFRRHPRADTHAPGRRIAAILGLILLSCCGLATLANDQFDELLSFDTRPPNLVVLFDGRVMHGQVSERPGGYLIDGAEGSQVLPFQMVRLTASSLDDAYVKQRDALRMPTAGDHLQLARWCHENKLTDAAKEQLAAALRLEPDRSDARRLLQDINAAAPVADVPGTRGARPAAGAATTVPLTAAGISTGAHAEFVRRVQPILVNRCGNAACHGSAAKNDFKLLNVRTGHRQQRRETDLNLATVLRYLDPQLPDGSPLLAPTVNADSGAHRAVFSGPGRAAQLEALRAWVRTTSRELAGPAAAPAWAANDGQFASPAAFEFEPGFSGDSTATPAGGALDPGNGFDVRQAAAEATTGLESPLLIEISRSPAAAAAPTPSADRPATTAGPSAKRRNNRSAAEQSAFLKQILEEDRPDAFDPNEFNRKVHGLQGGR